MSAVQQDTVAWLREADHAGVLDAVLRPVLKVLHQPSVRSLGLRQLSLKLPPLPVLRPASFQLLVVSPAHPEERGGPGQTEPDGQRPPPGGHAVLLPSQGLEVCDAQEVLRAVRGRAEIQGPVCVQEHLAYACQSCAHLQEEEENIGESPHTNNFETDF